MTTRHPTPGPHPASDREALSALFDGELVGDVARFALKRLDHDQDWRTTCERWQVFGDVLRSRNAPLPLSFHARLRDAVHADARHAGHRTVQATRANRTALRWGSAALAASAAVVAVFLAGGPFGAGDAPRDAQVAEAPAQAAAKPQFASQAPRAPAIDLDTATAAVGVAAAAAAQRSRSLQRDRAATDRIVSSVVAAQSPVTAEAGPAPAAQPVSGTLVREVASHDASLDAGPGASAATSPFSGTPAPDARPWPRAVLPQYRDRGGALAADFATAPSFYPFAPAGPPPASDEAARAAPAGSPAEAPPPPP